MNTDNAAFEAWFADLASADPALADAVRRKLPAARRRALARTLLALGREGFLPAPPGPGIFRCPLPDGSGTLVATGFRGSPILLRSDLETLKRVDRNGGVEVITQPSRLLQLVATSQEDTQKFGPEAWERLADEVSNSTFNEALAQVAHKRTDERVLDALGQGRDRDVREAIHRLGPAPDGALFLDQWAATGHPLHLVPKARVGLGPAEALELLPEFHPIVSVRLAAVRRAQVCAELPKGLTRPRDWFAKTYPNWLQRWIDLLGARGLDAEAYEPFPVHPWQADHVLPALLGEGPARGAVTLLDGPGLSMLPCLSVRSLVPANAPDGPGFKLALGLRLTSGVRTITPRSCHMGQRIGKLLNQLFRQDSGFRGLAAGLEESIGAHFQSPQAPSALEKHLSFIARDSVTQHLESGEIAAPAAALAEPFPDHGKPLLLELMASTDSGSLHGLEAFEAYTEAFLRVVLRAFLIYGVALEAHGQNVLACFSAAGALTKFLFRDFAGIRIHEPTLRRRGLALEVHPDRRTVVETFDDHRFWLKHRVYHCHLGHLAHGLAGAGGQSEQRYWACVGDVTDRVFEQLREESDPKRWARERRELLEDDWVAKASLRMRMANQVRDLAVPTPNPLRFLRDPP